MRILYNVGIWLYYFAIQIASIWNPKARKWLGGRKRQKQNQKLKSELPGAIWIHAASLGEFEQGKPLIETLRKKYPAKPILLSFFSPSGMEASPYEGLVQHVIYLPLDTKLNARRFISTFQPALAIFIKYEIWYHFLNELTENQIPTIIVSGAFRTSQWFFRWPRIVKILRGLNQIFVQTEDSMRVLSNNGFKNMTLSGDGRIDRVAGLPSESAQISFNLPAIFEKSDLIAGSTHPQDYPAILNVIKQGGLRAIIVPHDIREKEIVGLEDFFEGKCFRFSRWQEGTIKDSDLQGIQIMILDTIGTLKYLYRFATCAYVGGGFSTGIHSILEPASYAIPIIFGPKHEKFQEAGNLIALGVAKSVQNEVQFEEAFQHFKKMDKVYVVDQFDSFFQKHKGATGKIMEYIEKNGILHPD